MDALFDQIRALTKGADEVARKKAIQGLRDLQLSLETPAEAVLRLIMQPVEIPVIRIGCDLKLFSLLAESASPLTASEISKVTGAAPLLTGRILRHLASTGCIKETDADTFTANDLTKALASPGWQGAILHASNEITVTVQELPEFLRKNGYKDIADHHNTPFQKAFNTSEPLFKWMPAQPERIAAFSAYMSVQREGMPSFLDMYPYQSQTQGLTSDQALFVDVGGSVGHQAVSLRKALPDVPNKVIIEDLPPVVARALKEDGVEALAQDFFEPQQVKGARMYYLRNILHDWPDDAALKIMTNLKNVMGPDSLLLIDETVVPNQNATRHATSLDFVLMSFLGARERTKAQWDELIPQAGLKMRNIYTYSPSTQDSVIECVLA